MTTESRKTSFVGLTEVDLNGVAPVDRIEIPLFQRDYAQGRATEAVRHIRTDFLDTLRKAVVGGPQDATGLDFVYGGVEDGTLRPLDGQQRLTTLFLLHWYIASRADRLDNTDGWTRFSYATRQSAWMFCESLIANPLQSGERPSTWIADQAWYLFVWRHDPTVQSMLLMLDAIDERFRDVDPVAAWARLTDPEAPAIWFLLLPLSGLGSGEGQAMRAEELYIKMNSRGKPLTEFENFKAHFEQTIQWSPRAEEFARNVDTCWSDLLWDLRGDDDLIDDEFLRYLEFAIELCEWREGRADGAGQRLGQRAASILSEGSETRVGHLDFLFSALDIWVDQSVPDTFAELFTTTGETSGSAVPKIRLFFRTDSGDEAGVNLFEACCRSYGESRGKTRVFSLGQTIVLYAVVLHLKEATEDFPRRVRILRNLIEASTDQLRASQMPKIIEDVHRVIRHGQVDTVTTLNQAQVIDETLKAAFLKDHPDLLPVLLRLEDQEFLRGSLAAFEPDADRFAERADVFERLMASPDLWPEVLAALLSTGAYQRRRTNGRPFLFGTDSKKHDSAWRDLLTGATRDALSETRETLATFLDRLTGAADLSKTMAGITAEYLTTCETEHRFDWRYYMVKYPAMRTGGSSTYFDSEHVAMGYSLCRLKAGGRALNGNYRDPYLLAISQELENAELVEDKWFYGPADQPRRLPLVRSGATIRCVTEGFELTPPSTEAEHEAFAAACEALNVDSDGIARVPQIEVDGRPIDTVDRIQLGAQILRHLADHGL